jgi:hypothetical protein
MKEIKAYQCEWCNKITKSKSGINKHENKCYKNPSLKSCYNCKYLTNSGYIVKIMTCEIFNKNISEEPWQIECDNYNYWGHEMATAFTCKRFAKKDEVNE